MNPHFPTMGSRELADLLREHGYVERRQTGSHRIFFHPVTKKTVPVPMGRRDMKIGTLRAILREAGIKLQEER